MKEELCNKLYNNYPDMFKPIWRGMKAEISCGDGWYDLINSLCSTITQICSENGFNAPAVGQIKEKFAGLRFYIGYQESDNLTENVFDKIQDTVNQYEFESTHVCEKCGAPGRVRSFSWIKTLCREHSVEWKGEEETLREEREYEQNTRVRSIQKIG